ncbi:1,2-phenylacetyl-CoA epoxidase subunit PaaC [Pedomonas mirosovicensis]|uniref:1,2-phenylacetyl-CoA epoxidase subunit PaaC n=1 Tax=Pedomonas mirosovicensis TaxID=2908641 RepID=UPI002169770E|nr:1,2-phenylacetyl-CoA epoxidase subunit PaaC [Pedomonas mirosovicensis]MCH8684512.1 phenylacetate-CoA oxygenase subunit PaaC [Pedomonas mirosovicensis]
MTAIGKDDLFEYALRLGDTSLVLGHRLSEWCGHAPEMELDVAMSNLGLDLIGQSRLFLTYAGEIEGQIAGGRGRDEDALAYLRDVLDYRNFLLVEQPNGDWAATIARQFYFSTFQQLYFEKLAASADEQLAAIARKALPEIAYHVRFASEWVVRLGDGTEESKRRMQEGLNQLWRFTGEMFESDDVEDRLTAANIAPDAAALRPLWQERIERVLSEATLDVPAPHRPVVGGRKGHHTEHLGYLLAEMQFLQRAYPGATW